jgi:hypothetical protein
MSTYSYTDKALLRLELIRVNASLGAGITKVIGLNAGEWGEVELHSWDFQIPSFGPTPNFSLDVGLRLLSGGSIEVNQKLSPLTNLGVSGNDPITTLEHSWGFNKYFNDTVYAVNSDASIKGPYMTNWPLKFNIFGRTWDPTYDHTLYINNIGSASGTAKLYGTCRIFKAP